MLDPEDSTLRTDDRDGVEAALVTGVAMAREPDACNPLDLGALTRVDGLQRVSPTQACPRLHFDERDGTAAPRDQVDLLMAEAIVAREHAPARSLEVPRRQILTTRSQTM